MKLQQSCDCTDQMYISQHLRLFTLTDKRKQWQEDEIQLSDEPPFRLGVNLWIQMIITAFGNGLDGVSFREFFLELLLWSLFTVHEKKTVGG